MKIASNRVLCVCLIALAFGLLPLYGCGGSGGGGIGGGGGADALGSVASIVEENNAEEEISEAAGNKPRAGSVTQSSNASGGVTTDSVSVRASYRGGGQVQYEVENRPAGWSVDSAADTVLDRISGSALDGAELMRRLPGGDLYVDVYSEKRVRQNQDYVAGGLWAFVPKGATGVDDLDLGVFVDGDAPFRNFPSRGFEKYSGDATFMYVLDGRISFATGVVSLNLDLTTGKVSGSIIVLDEDEYPADVPRLWLEPTPFGNSAGGFFQGDTGFFPEAEALGFSVEGKWGGQFFGNEGRIPRTAAGTFGVTGTDDDSGEVAALGVWIVQLEDSNLPATEDPPPSTSGEVPSHPTITYRFSDPSPDVGHSVDLILSWNEIPGATSYKVHINEFSTIYIRYRQESGGGCVLSFRPNQPSADIRAGSTSYLYKHNFIARPGSNDFRFDVQACNAAGCSCPPPQ